MLGSVIRRLETKSPGWIFFTLTSILLLLFAAAYFSSYLSRTAKFLNRQDHKGEHLRSALDLALIQTEARMHQQGFDLESGQGLGAGLGLVKSLMHRKGAWLSIHEYDGRVNTELELHAPAISW